ncbi:MAG: hypothetical protein L3J08_03465 [Flavobacteriaceae bacterium]|nr:hypothetical protein [Flavobacteriaceae bacterium]
MNKLTKNNFKKEGYVYVLLGVVLVSAFLSGKIIYIPKGTHLGGIYAAIGVAVILLTIFFLIYIRFNQVKKDSYEKKE